MVFEKGAISPKKSTGKIILDKSPKRNPKEASSSKAYRKSPSRAEVPKSPEKLIKSPPVSPSRNLRPRSPGRTSPARNASPTRSRTQSSAHKLATERPTSKTRGRKSKSIIYESDSDDVDSFHPSEKPKATVRGRARRTETEKVSPKVILRNIRQSVEKELENYIGVVRRSAQKSQPLEVERIVHLQREPSIKKISEFSEEDDDVLIGGKTSTSKPKIVKDGWKIHFGRTIGALLALCYPPLIAIGLYVFCNETHCSATLPSFQRYKYLSTFFEKRIFLIFTGYTVLVAILSAIPFFGLKVNGMPNKQGKLNYTMNGLFIAAVSVLTLFTLEFFNISLISIILSKYFQFIVSGIIIGSTVSLFLHARSFFVPVSALNPRAITTSGLHNFIIGQELNPRPWKNLDMKMFLLRIIVIGGILLNATFIYKSFEFAKGADEESGFDIKSLRINPTLLVLGSLQMVYLLDFLIFESATVTTYTIQHEGVGYFFCVSAFTGIFQYSSALKYVYDYKATLPLWQLIASSLLFFCGYFLYRASNLQKHAFRQNPYSSAISHLESLPTTQGKKLLVSGFWGFVRHPNYLGDILIHLSFLLFVLTRPPAIAYLLDIVYLIYKAHQDGEKCKQQYGTVWNRYCKRVKYVLIPKVY